MECAEKRTRTMHLQTAGSVFVFSLHANKN